MKPFSFLALAAALAFFLLFPVSQAQDKPAKNNKATKTPAAAPAGAPFVEEKGRFKVLVDGQPAATEEFQISSSGGEWHARGSADVPAAPGGASHGPSNGTTHVTGKLDLTPDGAPLRYEWSASTSRKASATIEFHGSTAQMELRMEGSAPFNQEFSFDSPRVLILDDNLFHHYAILARLYDWKAKGPQSFSVFIPQETTPGVVLVEYVGPKVVESVQLEMLRVRSADNEIELYCDNSSRLMRISVPSSKVEIIRE